MSVSKTLLQTNDLAYKYPNDKYVFSGLGLSLSAKDRIALVGINGSGKTTLLKVFAGIFPPTKGELHTKVQVEYVSQIELETSGAPLFEYLQTQIENWWDVLTEVEKLFNTKLNPKQAVNEFSGGEWMKIKLGLAMVRNPSILLLDEPTNHLDLQSIQTLITFVSRFNGACVIVSHDTFFLDQVTTATWEIKERKITIYGGNYSFYKEQKRLELEGRKRQYEEAKRKLEHAQELKQKKQEEFQQKEIKAKEKLAKGGVDKVAFGFFKGRATKSRERGKTMLGRMKAEATEKMEKYGDPLRKLAFMGVESSAEDSKHLIAHLKDQSISAGEKLLLKSVTLPVYYGDRIVIAGKNGSGKTTLARCVQKASKGVTAYVDQQYSLIDPDKSLLENVVSYGISVSYQKAREQLGRFQFTTELEVSKPARDFSGGELARIMLAIITSQPIELLILDEPTNNLDVETTEMLVKALNEFRGALIIISHNVGFLSQVGIEKVYVLGGQKLNRLHTLPTNKEGFYGEVLGV